MTKIELKKLRLAHKNMLSRCYDSNNASYEHYGARGITVCAEWLDETSGRYEFIEWALHNGHSMGLSLDRIDTNAGYSPENCKWSTIKEQLRNQRRNHLISYQGRTQTLSAWAEELGIQPSTLHRRVSKYNMSVEKALTPVIRTWQHGTRTGYEIHKCKCNLCRESNNRRHRNRRAAAKRLNGDVV